MGSHHAFEIWQLFVDKKCLPLKMLKELLDQKYFVYRLRLEK